MWESQAGLMATALSGDEIQRLYVLHTDLDTFSAMRTRLQDAFASPRGEHISKEFDVWMRDKAQGLPVPRPGEAPPDRVMALKLQEFNDETRTFWDECYNIYNRTGQSNPIHEDPPLRRVANWLKRNNEQRALPPAQ